MRYILTTGIPSEFIPSLSSPCMTCDDDRWSVIELRASPMCLDATGVETRCTAKDQSLYRYRHYLCIALSLVCQFYRSLLYIVPNLAALLTVNTR